MGELEIQQSILKALNKMSFVQQVKLLEFINSMQAYSSMGKGKDILQLAGIFDSIDTDDFESALKDTEYIDDGYKG